MLREMVYAKIRDDNLNCLPVAGRAWVEQMEFLPA